MKIVAARQTHLPGILKIYNHAILHSTAVYYYKERTLEQMTTWYESLKQDSFPVLCALSDEDEVLGFASYGKFRMKPAYNQTAEHSVYVHTSHRGKGLGSLLLQEIIALARKNKIHSLIGGIDAENKGSIAFHEKMGFQQVALLKEVGYKFDRRLDLSFMQLILQP